MGKILVTRYNLVLQQTCTLGALWILEWWKNGIRISSLFLYSNIPLFLL